MILAAFWRLVPRIALKAFDGLKPADHHGRDLDESCARLLGLSVVQSQSDLTGLLHEHRQLHERGLIPTPWFSVTLHILVLAHGVDRLVDAFAEVGAVGHLRPPRSIDHHWRARRGMETIFASKRWQAAGWFKSHPKATVASVNNHPRQNPEAKSQLQFIGALRGASTKAGARHAAL